MRTEELEGVVSSIYQLFAEKKYSDALHKIEEAEKNFNVDFDGVSPSDKASFLNLKGFVLLALEMNNDAKQSFITALKNDHDSSQACAGLGEVFYLEGNDNKSKIMYEWAVKNNPNNNFAVAGLAKINKVLGKETEHNTLLELQINN